MSKFFLIKIAFSVKWYLFRLNKLRNIQLLQKEPLHTYLITHPNFLWFLPIEDTKYYTKKPRQNGKMVTFV